MIDNLQNIKDKQDINLIQMVKALNEMGGLSLYEFLQVFWQEVTTDRLILGWHMERLCDELEKIAERVGKGLPKEHDLLVNIPPGTTKTVIASIMFPAWCWTKWFWMRFITVSHSATLSLESAEKCRDVLRSEKYKMMYPNLSLKQDKDVKSNFRVIKTEIVLKGRAPRITFGGGRFSTSVGATTLGFHGHINIWDDPVNPKGPTSELEHETANNWLDQVLSLRKVDKKITVTIGIMQRLSQYDPSQHWLDKQKKNLKHICLPGEIINYKEQVKPAELIQYYQDGLLDPIRLDWGVLKEIEADIGQYGYAGQIGQTPSPPTGGMFKVDRFIILENLPPEVNFLEIARYWDKAGTDEKELKKGKKAAYTVGVKMIRLRNGNFIVMDVVRGRWSTETREAMILKTAVADGSNVKIYHEQEPGSGGKDSAKATTRMLAGFSVERDLPTGDKTRRADPYSVQVNEGNVMLLRGEWNHEYIEEHRFFPFSMYKDQVDASSGAFSKLVQSQRVQIL